MVRNIRCSYAGRELCKNIKSLFPFSKIGMYIDVPLRADIYQVGAPELSPILGAMRAHPGIILTRYQYGCAIDFHALKQNIKPKFLGLSRRHQ